MNSKQNAVGAGLVLALALTLPGLGGTAAAGVPSAGESDETITRVSLSTNETQGGERSTISYSSPAISDDGRYVVFSTDNRFSPKDTNGIIDVYRRNVVTGHTVLVSVTPQGVVGNDYSHEASISGSGRFVAFTSWATNLVRGDRNGSIDVLVKDMKTGRIERVSVSTRGRAFAQNSFFGVLSANGRYVAFQSFAPLGLRDEDRREDVYVHDRATDKTHQVSVRSDETDLPKHYLVGGISAGGRYVTFSDDNNAWLRDRGDGVTRRLWNEPDDGYFHSGSVGRVSISANGGYVAFSTVVPLNSGDKNEFSDIVRISLETGDREVVSLGLSDPAGDNESFAPTLSRSGRYVGFVSAATNLVDTEDTNDVTDVFIRDMAADATTLVSHGRRGPANERSGRSATASIGRDGQRIVFDSYASNLVRGDTNGNADVFVWSAG